MAIDPENLSPLEKTMLELQQAERAGVFAPTRVEARTLVAADSTRRAVQTRRLVIRLLPIAAVMMLAVTVWTWKFQSEFAELSRDRGALVADSVVPTTDSKSFAECIGGPSVTEIADACREHDRNADGLVDLRDFSSLQLASAHIAP